MLKIRSRYSSVPAGKCQNNALTKVSTDSLPGPQNSPQHVTSSHWTLYEPAVDTETVNNIAISQDTHSNGHVSHYVESLSVTIGTPASYSVTMPL